MKVAQERCLSTRIMHFTSTGVIWECPTLIANKAFNDGLSASFPEVEGVSRFAQLKKSLRSGHQTTKLYMAWIDFIRHYSGCQLTSETDKLIAINDTVQDFSIITGEAIVCGLWKSHLIAQLLWERIGNTASTPCQCHAPSWTWASVSARIHYDHALNHNQCFNTRDYVTLEGLQLNIRSSGQVDYASLILRCRLVYVILHIETEREVQYSEAEVIYRKRTGHHRAALFLDAFLDNVKTTVPYRRELCLVAVMGCIHGDLEIPNVVYALILDFHDAGAVGGTTKYKRIGLCRMNPRTYEDFHPHESAEEQTITIV